jgi:hypothetical protein
MDCLEFRRLLLSDPQVRDREARAHLAICAGCAALTAQAQAFESRLSAVLSVPVPEGLADRILVAQRAEAIEPFQPRRRLGWIAFAAAASVLLAFGVLRYQRSAASLPDLVAAHVTAPDERDALDLHAPVPMTDIQNAFSERGVKLADVPPEVAYVSDCGIGRWQSVHMVMSEQEGPVSVVYIVRERAADRTDSHRAGLITRAVPIADGTLFMLARSDRRFDAIEHAWRNAIEGSPKIAAGSY